MKGVQAETCLKGWWKSAGKGEGKENSKPREVFYDAKPQGKERGTLL